MTSVLYDEVDRPKPCLERDALPAVESVLLARLGALDSLVKNRRLPTQVP